MSNLASLMENLGFALLNSIWQMAILFVVIQIVFLLQPSLTARQRYVFQFNMLLAGFALFVYQCFFPFSYSFVPGIAEQYISYTSSLNIIHYISIAYCCYVMIILVRQLLAFRSTWQLLNKPQSPAPARYRLFTQKVAQRLGISQKVALYTSEHIGSPLTYGFFKPVILFPIALLNRLSTQQVEAILIHELQHIKNNDFVINIALMILENVFFFNPFARKLINAIRKEREFACDDLVLQFKYTAVDYAETLYMLEQFRVQPHFLLSVQGNNEHQLLSRIERMIFGRVPKNSISWKPFLAAALLLFGTLYYHVLKNRTVIPIDYTLEATSPIPLYYPYNTAASQIAYEYQPAEIRSEAMRRNTTQAEPPIQLVQTSLSASSGNGIEPVITFTASTAAKIEYAYTVNKEQSAQQTVKVVLTVGKVIKPEFSFSIPKEENEVTQNDWKRFAAYTPSAMYELTHAAEDLPQLAINSISSPLERELLSYQVEEIEEFIEEYFEDNATAQDFTALQKMLDDLLNGTFSIIQLNKQDQSKATSYEQARQYLDQYFKFVLAHKKLNAENSVL